MAKCHEEYGGFATLSFELERTALFVIDLLQDMFGKIKDLTSPCLGSNRVYQLCGTPARSRMDEVLLELYVFRVDSATNLLISLD